MEAALERKERLGCARLDTTLGAYERFDSDVELSLPSGDSTLRAGRDLRRVVGEGDDATRLDDSFDSPDVDRPRDCHVEGPGEPSEGSPGLRSGMTGREIVARCGERMQPSGRRRSNCASSPPSSVPARAHVFYSAGTSIARNGDAEQAQTPCRAAVSPVNCSAHRVAHDGHHVHARGHCKALLNMTSVGRACFPSLHVLLARTRSTQPDLVSDGRRDQHISRRPNPGQGLLTVYSRRAES